MKNFKLVVKAARNRRYASKQAAMAEIRSLHKKLDELAEQIEEDECTQLFNVDHLNGYIQKIKDESMFIAGAKSMQAFMEEK